MSCDPNQLDVDAKSLTAIPPGNVPFVVTYLLCQIARAGDPSMSCDPNELQAAAKCFCGIDPLTISYIQTYLLCQIMQNGGGGGGSCLLCGVVSPIISGVIPECECAVYYNKLTSEFWDWDGSQWVPFIREP